MLDTLLYRRVFSLGFFTFHPFCLLGWLEQFLSSPSQALVYGCQCQALDPHCLLLYSKCAFSWRGLLWWGWTSYIPALSLMVLPPGLGLLPPPSLWVLGWSCQVWVCGPCCPPRLTICHRWVIVTRLTFSHFSAFASSDGLSFFLLCSTGIEVFSSTYPVAVLICPAQSFAPAGGFNQARPSYSGTGLL